MHYFFDHTSSSPRPHRRPLRLVPALAALMLSGCMVGPDFQVPDAPAASGYTAKGLQPTQSTKGVPGGGTQNFALGQDVSADWWTLFGSKQLNAFVEEAVRNHPSVEAAEYALRSARETALSTDGNLYPQVSLSDTSTRARNAASGGAPPNIYNLYNASVGVSYGLDLFGGARRQSEAKYAAADYQRYQLEATYLSLTANVVNAAITEASLRAQINATESIVKLQQDQLERIQKQFELGAVPNSDVLSQQSNLAQTQASLPTLQKQLAQQRNALMAYLGRLPSQDRGESIDLSQLRLPKSLPVSLPSDLVRQRPDIKAAEATLHQASASVGVSVASMLPQVSLSGQYGGSSASLSHLLSPDSIAWSIAASVTQKLIDGGSAFHSKEASVATYEQNLANYKSTVITAFQNVADSLRAIEFDAKALQAQSAAERSAKASLDMARDQYKTGAVVYATVLNALQTYQNAVISRVKAQATRYTDTVALYQSLGGGWWNRNDETDRSKPRVNPGYFAGPTPQSQPADKSNEQNKKDSRS
ncbi:MAG TPA: efflux transporter outer membrane subunit [Ensifer sp.]|nr:efflux transporter outer membrane subunit [Ensifer sp.]